VNKIASNATLELAVGTPPFQLPDTFQLPSAGAVQVVSARATLPSSEDAAAAAAKRTAERFELRR
jgi:hypothetical protein